MANDFENWYAAVGKKQLDELKINLNNPEDVKRLRIPPLNAGSDSRQLFENGFQNTPENRKKLYECAKSGQLFAFQKGTDKPYQITEQGNVSCDKADYKEEKKASMLQKAGYAVGSRIWPLARFGIRLTTRIANILTFGLADKQIKEFEAGVDKYAGKASEYVFNVSAQKREKANTVAYGERFLNLLTRGYYHRERIQNIDRQKTYESQRNSMRNSLDLEKQQWQKKTLEENQRRAEEQKKSKVQKELERTKNKINNLNQPTTERTQTKTVQRTNNTVQRQGNTQGNNDNGAPADSGKQMKTKLQMQYEEMRMAFGPGGGGFDEAVKVAQNMNVMIKELRENPDKLKASGMSEEKLQEFSNMCQTIESVRNDGLQATADLMDKDVSKTLTPQQREQNICKMQLMHMVERAMVNSAFASYLDNDKQPGKDLSDMKNSRLFNAMKGDPEAFKKSMNKGIKMMDSTAAYKAMSTEELAEFIAEPEKVRGAQTADIQAGARKSREERQQKLEIEKQKQMDLQLNGQKRPQNFTIQKNAFEIQKPEQQQQQLQQQQLQQPQRENLQMR